MIHKPQSEIQFLCSSRQEWHGDTEGLPNGKLGFPHRTVQGMHSGSYCFRHAFCAAHNIPQHVCSLAAHPSLQILAARNAAGPLEHRDPNPALNRWPHAKNTQKNHFNGRIGYNFRSIWTLHFLMGKPKVPVTGHTESRSVRGDFIKDVDLSMLTCSLFE